VFDAGSAWRFALWDGVRTKAPNQQIVPVIQFAAGTMSKRRLFLAGSDNVYSRTIHAIFRDALAERHSVRIVSEAFFPLGSSDVNGAIAKITANQADLIINTISGETNEAFYRALRAAGITSENTPTISLTESADELRTLPVEQRIGNYAVRSYFQSIDRPENAAFVHKFQTRFGTHRVVTDPMESAYVAVHLWARAVTEANDTRPALVRQAIKGLRFNAPGGPMRIDPANQYAWKVERLGRIDQGGQFKIVWSSEEPIHPEPFPATRKRTEWLRFLDETYRDLGGRWGR
jgi:urea transport system substrate-binding protein